MTASNEETPPTPMEVEPVLISPPPEEQQVQREAVFTPEGERKTRHSLPTGLQSASPIGYRTRLSLTIEEATSAMALLSLRRPTAFVPPSPVPESEFFEECSLGVLSARQSTNYRGQRQSSLGPEHSAQVAELLRHMLEGWHVASVHFLQAGEGRLQQGPGGLAGPAVVVKLSA